MEDTQTRTVARRIESALLNKIAVKGSVEIASAIGVDRSQVTRWKETFIPRMSMLLAILEWGVVDDDLARLANQVAAVLTKRKAPTVKVEANQISMEF